MIVVEDLVRRFGARTAVDGITFSVEKGEVVGFLGPNGAGKTTTLRILAGFIPASSGRAMIAGHDITAESLAARASLGYLPESVPLYPEMRVSELMSFQARLRGIPRSAAPSRIQSSLERVGVMDRAGSTFGRLSKGLRQRVGIAMALLPDPPVLLLDEPTSGLDPLQRIELRKLIRELATRRTVLVSSHVLPEVEAMTDRVIVLDCGRILGEGRVADLAAAIQGGELVRVELSAPGIDVADVVSRLSAIEGVEDARVIGGAVAGGGGAADPEDVPAWMVLLLQCAGDERARIASAIADAGWELREMSTQGASLERIFDHLAGGDGRTPDGQGESEVEPR